MQIQWHHPVHGVGCLTAILDGDGRDLLEPRDAVAEGRITAIHIVIDPAEFASVQLPAPA
ncbi:hypothetical protein [Saccharothrix sp. NRRL B-16314]|uniref:hypothetical protein n=1 Tax=Saccharothrix sp. NRRL B-16314 TaxID=1463825 RepID=UPI000524C0FC|nr:hypothetical protein [Saccharothrix sp. NRRL B-16314]